MKIQKYQPKDEEKENQLKNIEPMIEDVSFSKILLKNKKLIREIKTRELYKLIRRFVCSKRKQKDQKINKKDEEVENVFENSFDEYQKERMSVERMWADMKKKLGSKLKIGKSTFYSRYLKKSGFVFKRGKIRFGPKDDEKKQFSRLTNGLLIQQLSLANSEVYFYDETILSMGTFVKKYWWEKGQENIIRLRRPTLMLRINMIVS